MNTRTHISLLAFILICASSHSYSQDAAKAGGVYKLGPYPVPFEQKNVKTHFWSWLHFTPIVEGRANPTYKLVLTIYVQVNHLSKLLSAYAEKELPRDNCARLNVDNWVYAISPKPLEIIKDHTLRLSAAGDFSTWTCLPGVVETVCDEYQDDLGLTHPYNCRTRPSNPIKSRNLQQGFELTKDFYLNVTEDGRLQFADHKAIVWFTGDSLGTQLLNIVGLMTNNLGAALSNAYFSTKTIESNVPDDFKAFNPKYVFGGFRVINGVEFVIASASVSISTRQINEFMDRHFGNLWTELKPVTFIEPAPMTKALLKLECAKFAPGKDIEECAANMGWDYSALPD